MSDSTSPFAVALAGLPIEQSDKDMAPVLLDLAAELIHTAQFAGLIRLPTDLTQEQIREAVDNVACGVLNRFMQLKAKYDSGKN